MNIRKNYNICNFYSKFKMKVGLMKDKPIEKTSEKSAENIIKTLCDFNSHNLNFDDFYKIMHDTLNETVEIKNCDKNLYQTICNKLNKVIGTDPLDIQLYRMDINKFLSNLYEKGEYKIIFKEKQFDIMYKKEQELKSYKPSWLNNGIS